MDLKKIIDKVTEGTNGKIIYRKQMVEILSKLGYSEEEAEKISKIIAKKLAGQFDGILEDMLKRCENDEESVSRFLESCKY